MSWTQRPASWGIPGHVNRGTEYEEVLDQIESLTAPGWTSYTPAWTSAGTQPALGNGTIAGRYRKVAEGDWVYAEFKLTMGSTTTFGTSFYSFSLPLTASATGAANATGAALILDSGTQDRMATCKMETTTTVQVVTASGTITNTSPQTFATGDVIRWEILYEPA